MKDLKDYIREELLYERFVGDLDNKNVKVNMENHSEERQLRNTDDQKYYEYISKNQLLCSIDKIIKDLKEDLELNLIKLNDTIIIEDKSLKPSLYLICNIYNDKHNKLIVNIVTHMRKNNFLKYNYSKLYTTYTSNIKVSKNIHLFKNEI